MTRGTAAPEESREIVRHLLRGCAVCASRAEAARGAERPQGPESYDEVFARLERQVAERVQRFEKERQEALPLYTELLGQQAVQGLCQVHSTRRYASLALCELLLETARDLSVEVPPGARRAAEPRRGGRRAARPGALRLAGGAGPAGHRLGLFRRHRAGAGRPAARQERHGDRGACSSSRGPATPLVRSELLAFQASLYTYSGQFDEALPILNRLPPPTAAWATATCSAGRW